MGWGLKVRERTLSSWTQSRERSLILRTLTAQDAYARGPARWVGEMREQVDQDLRGAINMMRRHTMTLIAEDCNYVPVH